MKKITEKQLTNLLENGNLCEYCPYFKCSNYPGELCDGVYCEDAKDNYVECNDLEYEED